jgi:hypothetical protein
MSLGTGGGATRGEEDHAMIETEGGSKEVAVKTNVRKPFGCGFRDIVNAKNRSIIRRRM